MLETIISSAATTFATAGNVRVVKFEGRALALNASVKIVNTRLNVAVPDSIKPTVSSRSPVNAATGVPVGSKLTVTFSKAMDPATITTATLSLKQGASAVSGTVTYSGVTAVFVPNSKLDASAVYTATITTGAKDLAGNAAASNYVWNFITGAAPDVLKPSVTLLSPADLATGVALNKTIAATFSEAMAPLTLSTATFTLVRGATAVSGTVSYSGGTAVFTPTCNLAANIVYTATITTGAKDLAGNVLARNYVWSFTTTAAGSAPVDLGTAGNVVILSK